MPERDPGRGPSMRVLHLGGGGGLAAPRHGRAQDGIQRVADDANQSKTWRRVVGPFGVHGDGSAPSSRRCAASSIFVESGSVMSPQRIASGSSPKSVAALCPKMPTLMSSVSAGYP